jgi:hypothetical protein
VESNLKVKMIEVCIMARDTIMTFNAWSFDDDKLADIQNAIEGQNQTGYQKVITILKYN